MSEAALSVVLATDCYSTIRPVIARLREQEARGRIEIVLVGPTRAALEPDPPELEGFAGVQIVALGSIEPLSAARAAGVRAATAPHVFLGETHVFPQPGWAEALLAAHAAGWPVVVPAIGNANPESAISWANLMADYGPWLDGLPAGEVLRVPTWNTSYRRDLLLAFDGRLDSLLSCGDALQLALQAQGHRFYREPAAKLDHLNVARPGSWRRERWLAGLLIASSRMGDWTTARRMLYVGAAPLIPMVVLSRALPGVMAIRRANRPPLLAFAWMAAGACLSAAGEMIAYAGWAPADAAERMSEYEVHKAAHAGRGSGPTGDRA